MKKTFIILTALVLSLNLSAQKRGKKVKEPVYTVTPQEAMAAYDFSLAEEILQHKIADLTKKKQPTIQEEALLETVRKSQIRLHATEQVTFIDSMVLPKKQVLKQIKLSQECGTIMTYADFFKSGSTDCTLFLNELGNRIVYAEADKKGHLRLKEKSLIGGEWSMERQLTGFGEEEEDNLNFPFMLTDGITMYYAADCEESIGGYSSSGREASSMTSCRPAFAAPNREITQSALPSERTPRQVLPEARYSSAFRFTASYSSR